MSKVVEKSCEFADKKFSTELANSIVKFGRIEYALGVFLDLSKTFDSVASKILLYKFEYYGF